MNAEITFDDPEFHKRETQIIGSRNATKEGFQTVMLAICQKLIDTDALCSQTVAYEEFRNRFPELVEYRNILIKAVVTI
ncbi:MAG: hypothetical protein ABJY83_23520 [Roseibium sp.]